MKKLSYQSCTWQLKRTRRVPRAGILIWFIVHLIECNPLPPLKTLSSYEMTAEILDSRGPILKPSCFSALCNDYPYFIQMLIFLLPYLVAIQAWHCIAYSKYLLFSSFCKPCSQFILRLANKSWSARASVEERRGWTSTSQGRGREEVECNTKGSIESQIITKM